MRVATKFPEHLEKGMSLHSPGHCCGRVHQGFQAAYLELEARVTSASTPLLLAGFLRFSFNPTSSIFLPIRAWKDKHRERDAREKERERERERERGERGAHTRAHTHIHTHTAGGIPRRENIMTPMTSKDNLNKRLMLESPVFLLCWCL